MRGTARAFVVPVCTFRRKPNLRADRAQSKPRERFQYSTAMHGETPGMKKSIFRRPGIRCAEKMLTARVARPLYRSLSQAATSTKNSPEGLERKLDEGPWPIIRQFMAGRWPGCCPAGALLAWARFQLTPEPRWACQEHLNSMSSISHPIRESALWGSHRNFWQELSTLIHKNS